jgi:hypothetical protein
MIRIQVDGTQAVINELNAKPAETRRALVAALWGSGTLVRNAAVNGIRKGPKSGRWYKRGGVRHRASAQGEYPAADTGTLMKSIDVEVDEMALHVDVGTSLAYGKILELKDPAHGGRPWLSRAWDETKDKVAAAIVTALGRVFPADRRVTRL